MRIGCLQFAPQVGDVNNNLNRADAVLNRADPDSLDLLVLPELAFSGYNFKSLAEISQFLEHSGSGISSLWARTIALKYDCTVVVGYPEKVDVAQKWPTGPEYYNAAIVVNGDGETVANYRKSHLFMTDEKWALENPRGFYKGFLVGLGRTAIGICMDLNPYRFQAPWNAFEFAFHVLEMDANLVILSMAWMTREDGRMFSRMPQEPDMDTLSYWVSRLEPVIRSDNDDEIIVVFANRTGIEDDAVYAGTSAVMGIKDGEVRVYGILGRGDKELLVVDTNSQPYARLVYRPDGSTVDISHTNKQGKDSQIRPNHPQSSNSNQNSPSMFSNQSPEHGESGNGTTDSSRHGSPKRNGTKSARTIKEKKLSVKTQSTPARHRDDPSPIVHTPTCPSPTPIALRPRLMIPPADSLTIKYINSHIPTPHPLVPRSAIGESLVARHLDPEPPASQPWLPNGNGVVQVLGGNVSFGKSQTLAGISPQDTISHFSDESPISPHLYWIPSNKLLETPIRHRPDGTNSESDGTAFSEAGSAPGRSDVNSSLVSRRYPGSATQTVIHTKNEAKNLDEENKPSQEASIEENNEPHKNGDSFPDRPASPKSRNASRSRGPERPGSAIEPNTDLQVISQKLDEIAKRVSSAQGRGTPNQSRGTGPNAALIAELQDQRLNNASTHSIPIAACISLWEDEHLLSNESPLNGQSRTPQDTSLARARTHSHSRTRSASNNFRGRDADRPPSRAANIPGGNGTPLTRTVSRGRQPVANNSSTPSGSGSQNPRAGRRSRPSGSAGPVDLSQFRLIEEFTSPDCPLHGSRSQSASQSHTPNHNHSHNHTPHQNSPRPRRRTSNEPSNNASNKPNRATAVREPQKRTDSPITRAKTSAPALSATRAPPTNGISSAKAQRQAQELNMSIDTLTSGNPSPQTPFEPTTPKAMKLVYDMKDTAELDANLKCVERVKGMDISRPKSAVW